MPSTRNVFLLALAAALAFPAASEAQVRLTGAGATFPYPIYSKWFDEYRKVRADVQINYQSIGSGGGIRQVTEGTVDFGATDGPMTEEQLSQFATKRGGAVMHFPTVLGAVVPVYNLPAVTAQLRFTSAALAGIYLGTITKWNDPAIASANPGAKLPASDIVVVRRSDGSGTSFVWTDYLSKVSADWKAKVGANTAVNWPVGLGGKGNEGVAGLVKQTAGSIGYIELVYALQNKMAFGRVQNPAGEFVAASLSSVTAAASGAAANMPADFRVSITNAPGKAAYPIASFTWLLIPTQQAEPAKQRAITDFLKWMLADGQKLAEPLGYAPLPKAVVTKELQQLSKLK
ncbi:MAG: phosphate ABC transporter substrate-binding protein PstS [Gemmatimonadetes bacterium]|nr:phosphate ABC transporter substrate-binding protein PstS [Gemmatimonadota bacterium]